MRIGLATDNSQLFEVAIKVGRNKVDFFIDTGASITILPKRMAFRINLNGTPEGGNYLISH